MPCPNSVEETRIRGRPSGVISISTRELRRRSPEPVKPAPWKKVAKPMPRLMVRGGVFAVELVAFGVVAGLCEGASEQVLHVDLIFEELAGRGAAAGGEEVAAAEFFGGEADDLGDLVHVALEGEEALRCAEAAEGSVGRDVGGHGFGADRDVRASDRGRGRGWCRARGRPAERVA